MSNPNKLSRKEQRERLKQRQERMGEEKKKNFDRHLDFSSYAGGDVIFYKPEITEKDKSDIHNYIDLIPYNISSENHPDIKEMGMGAEDFFLNYSVHQNVGAKSKAFICLEQTYGKFCPICDARTKLYKEGGEENKKKAKPLWPKKRILYNVIDTKDPEKGIQLWDISVSLFTEEMNKQYQRSLKDSPIRYIADLDEGFTIRFIAERKEIKTDTSTIRFFESTDFSFIDRDKPYQESIIDEAYPLDSFLIIKSEEEIAEAFFGFSDVQEDEIVTHVSTDNEKTTDTSNTKNKIEDDSDNFEIECPAGYEFGEEYEADAKECKECKYIESCKEKMEG